MIKHIKQNDFHLRMSTMKFKKILKILVILGIPFMTLCYYCSYKFKISSVEYYERLIVTELKIGDSTDDIEAFFNKHNFKFEILDHRETRFATYPYKFYFSRVYDEREMPGLRLIAASIDVFIFLDDDMKFKDFLVEEFSTGL